MVNTSEETRARLALVREQLGRLLAETVADPHLDRDGDLYVDLGDRRVYTQVAAFGDNATLVRALCVAAESVAPRPELFELMAREAARYPLASLAAYSRDDGTIDVNVSYSALAEGLAAESLFVAVAAVAAVAEDLGGLISQRLGLVTRSGRGG